jgi:hypothetical protein
MHEEPVNPSSCLAPAGLWLGRSRTFWSAVLFALLAVCYAATEQPIAGRVPTDYSPNSLVPIALLQHGSCDLTPYDALLQPRHPSALVIRSGGRLVSFYPIGASVSALPFFLPYLLPGQAPVTMRDAEHLGRVAASFFAAASAVLLLWVLWEWTTAGRALALSVLYGLGTCNLSTLSKALWQHAPSEFWIAAGIYALSGARLHRSRWLAAGACLGMSVFCRPSNLPFLLAPMAWLLLERRFKAVALVALGACLPAGLNVAYNVTYLGGVVSGGGYGTPLYDLRLHSERIWGMLVSPGRGLFVFIPFLLLLPAALWNLRSVGREQQRLVASMVAGFLGSLYITNTWHVWWGGYSFGPRMLSDGTPALVVALATLPFGRVWSVLLALLGACSIAIHLLGAIVVGRPLWWDQVYMPSGWDSTENLWSVSRAPLVFYARLWARERFDLRPDGQLDPQYCRGTIDATFPAKVRRESHTLVWVSLQNRGAAEWWQIAGDDQYGEMHLTYRWIKPDGEAFGGPGVRSVLWDDLAPGQSGRSAMTVVAPVHPGPWTLRLTATAERIRWCDEGPAPLYLDLPVSVR